jgi:hypothetical protein
MKHGRRSKLNKDEGPKNKSDRIATVRKRFMSSFS